MCGRFEQHVRKMHGWAELLKQWPTASTDRFNIPPTAMAMTYDAEGWSERSWSLIPKWSKSPKLKYPTFNARAETLTEKASFRGAWKHSQRCLIPASAYFEWPTIDGKKQCHSVELADNAAMMLGGLWETWNGDGETKHTFTVITAAPIPALAELHHRMPLILPESSADVWLHGAPDEAAELLTPQVRDDFIIGPIAKPIDRKKAARQT